MSCVSKMPQEELAGHAMFAGPALELFNDFNGPGLHRGLFAESPKNTVSAAVGKKPQMGRDRNLSSHPT